MAVSRPLSYAMVGGAEGSFIGPIHRMAIRLDDLATLVAGCFSRQAAKNRATGEALRLDPTRVYATWRDLIALERGKVDFLVISTTNETHFEIAKAALEAGMDVFCEKPISFTSAEAETLAALARRHRRIFGVPFTYLGYPMVKLARDLVKKGELGKIDKITLEYVKGSFRKGSLGRGWKVDPKIAGPSCVVSDLGVHGFSMIEYVTGLEVTRLMADLSSFGNSRGLDDDALMILHLEKGAKAIFTTSKVATGEENGVRLRVYGRKASLFWDQESPNQLVVRSPFEPDRVYHRRAPYVGALSPASVAASRFPAGHHEGFVEALANIYDAFVAAVRTRKTGDFPSAREGVRSIRFVEAALRSAKNNSAWTDVS